MTSDAMDFNCINLSPPISHANVVFQGKEVHTTVTVTYQEELFVFLVDYINSSKYLPIGTLFVQ